ncbi:hypothetical protein [Paraburkholderia sp. J8-2]|uniref:hypothetical protein n=1 Tax=Paraburkholderia sp. J8-2 TaxID=2805440 RepID=UPI002AB5F6A1|nr:hypothetical protein [Paraburkholderia sp. J8-2]
MEAKKEEETSLSGEVIGIVKEELQLGKLRRCARTMWDFYANPEKISQAVASNSWSGYVSPISYYCLMFAGLGFVLSLTDEKVSTGVVDKLLEPLTPLLFVMLLVFPGAIFFHLALGKHRRKLRDVIHVSCYAQANFFFLGIIAAPFADSKGNLAIPEQPVYLLLAGYIAVMTTALLAFILIVRSAQIQMSVLNISFTRLFWTGLISNLWPIPVLLVMFLIAQLMRLFGH